MIKSRRRNAAVSDLVRILQSAHDQMASMFPKLPLRTLRRIVERQGPEERAAILATSTRRQYISGIVAGYSSKDGKLGLRCRQADPPGCCATSMLLRWRQARKSESHHAGYLTGDWSMPVKEAEATNSLIDQGVDVLTCHVDGPKTMVENAARRGAMVCGYHVNQSRWRPKAYLTGASGTGSTLSEVRENDRTPAEAIPNTGRALKEEIVKCSPLRARRSRRSAQACRRYARPS